jgi:glycosyltransferase involved in cell wall biosynthesis
VTGSATAPIAVELLRGFRASGWDAHLIWVGSGDDLSDAVADVSDEAVRCCVHPPPRGRRAGRGRVTGRLVLRLARGVVGDPFATAPSLQPWSRRQRPPQRDLYRSAVIAALRPQILHFLSAEVAEGRIGVARRLPTKTVVTLSEGRLLAPERLRDLGSLETADAIVVPPGPIARRAMKEGLPAERCVTLAPPLDRHERTDPGRAEDLRIVSIGELTWRGGFEHGIHATRLLVDRGIDCRYRIAGRGSHEGALRFARRELGMEEQVELLGDVERVDLRRELAWADVLVDPSVADVDDGLVELARELRLPIVVARRGVTGPAEDGVLTVPRRNPAALAARLAEIAASPDLRKRRAERAAPLEPPVTTAALADRLQAIYLHLLEERLPTTF